MDNGEAYRIAWRSTWEAAESLVHALREMVPADYGIELALERPRYIEKIEYLAFLWGTLVMAATGFTLWFNDLALRYLPKWVSDAATALHFYEAVLATCAILIWHTYTVVFDPMFIPWTAPGFPEEPPPNIFATRVLRTMRN